MAASDLGNPSAFGFAEGSMERASDASNGLRSGRVCGLGARGHAHNPAASAANAGGFLQTSLSEVIRRSQFRRSSALTRRITPDRVIAFTLLNTDIRGAPTARVGADQIDTCATSQNRLVKDEPECRYSAGAGD